MTSKRKQIMQAVANGAYLIDDMLHLGMPRKNLVDNIKACCVEKLLARERDVVTGQPGYKLTQEGRHWLETGETPRQHEMKQANPNTTTQAGSGEITPAAAHRATSLATKSGEGVAVNEPPQPEAKPVAVRSNECEMPTDKACCNAAAVVAKTAGGIVGELQKRCTEHEQTIANLQGALQKAENYLESISSATRKFCGIVGNRLILPCTKYPLNLHECSVELESYINMLQANIGSLQAENVALKTLNEALPGFGAAYAQNQGQQYAILTALDDIYSSPEEAANHAHEYAVQDDISKVQIIAIRPVGRVEVKAVFVPNKEAA